MTKVSFKAILVSKSMVMSPFGNKNIKLEFVEERELTMPVIIEGRGGELAREIVPVVHQVMRALPFTQAGKLTVPRMTIWLTDDEWDRLEPKPDIGEEVIVTIESNMQGFNVKIKPSR